MTTVPASHVCLLSLLLPGVLVLTSPDYVDSVCILARKGGYEVVRELFPPSRQ